MELIRLQCISSKPSDLFKVTMCFKTSLQLENRFYCIVAQPFTFPERLTKGISIEAERRDMGGGSDKVIEKSGNKEGGKESNQAPVQGTQKPSQQPWLGLPRGNCPSTILQGFHLTNGLLSKENRRSLLPKPSSVCG